MGTCPAWHKPFLALHIAAEGLGLIGNRRWQGGQSHTLAREGEMQKEPGQTPSLSHMGVIEVVVSSAPIVRSNDSMI